MQGGRQHGRHPHSPRQSTSLPRLLGLHLSNRLDLMTLVPESTSTHERTHARTHTYTQLSGLCSFLKTGDSGIYYISSWRHYIKCFLFSFSFSFLFCLFKHNPTLHSCCSRDSGRDSGVVFGENRFLTLASQMLSKYSPEGINKTKRDRRSRLVWVTVHWKGLHAMIYIMICQRRKKKKKSFKQKPRRTFKLTLWWRTLIFVIFV